MKIYYHFYGIEVDTKSKHFKDSIKKLDELYSQIPETKCLNCPNKDKVEADCCRVFSPPMLLIEFLNILKEVEKKTKEEQNELIIDCIKAFMCNDIERKCVLLSDILCDYYKERPLACRLFAMYSDKEWSERLEKTLKEIDIAEKDIPFYEQCRNIEVVGENEKPFSISKEKSDEIFKNIHNIDIDMFKEKDFGEEVVFSSATYMPFETHYLCLKIGDEMLEILTSLKLDLLKVENKKKKDSKFTFDYISKKKKIDAFLDSLFLEIRKGN